MFGGKASQPQRPPSMILTTACPDTTGVVAAVAGFLASHNCLITEAQHYDDSVSVTSFMRTVFHDNGKGAPSMQQLDEAFAGSVAQRFGMQWLVNIGADLESVVLNRAVKWHAEHRIFINDPKTVVLK